MLHELTGREAGLLYLLLPHLSGLDLDRVQGPRACPGPAGRGYCENRYVTSSKESTAKA